MALLVAAPVALTALIVPHIGFWAEALVIVGTVFALAILFPLAELRPELAMAGRRLVRDYANCSVALRFDA